MVAEFIRPDVVSFPATARDRAAGDGLLPLDEQIGFRLRRAHQQACSVFLSHFRETGLSPAQFATLVRIRDCGRVSQNELGRLVSMDPSSIMGVVNRLVNQNYVRRQADHRDRRRVMVTITSDGLKLLEACEYLSSDVDREILQNITPEERRIFYDILDRIG